MRPDLRVARSFVAKGLCPMLSEAIARVCFRENTPTVHSFRVQIYLALDYQLASLSDKVYLIKQPLSARNCRSRTKNKCVPEGTIVQSGSISPKYLSLRLTTIFQNNIHGLRLSKSVFEVVLYLLGEPQTPLIGPSHMGPSSKN
jgi:hypothetical protein